MTTTDELRAELTRRGVNWKRMRGHKHDGTEWHDASGAHVSAVQEYTWDGTEWPDGKLSVSRGAAWLTPEEVVDMTLGRGECRIRDEMCDQCGAIIHEHANMHWVPVGDGMRTVRHRPVRYCPNCGRKVVDE